MHDWHAEAFSVSSLHYTMSVVRIV